MGEHPGTGLFGSDSLTWRIGRESAVLLGGKRALLMQIAHPLVAQGVADHSGFKRDRLGRLMRTLRASFELIFSETEVALRTVRRIEATHARVRGTLKEDSGRFPAGTPYSADDPELSMWVHATLVDTAIHCYSRFVAPLSAGETDGFYRESVRSAMLMGVPAELTPPDHRSFVRYMRQTISRDIHVGETAKQLAHHLMNPMPRLPLRPMLDRMDLITVGTLPEQIRDGYGFGWGRGRQAALDAASVVIARSLRVVPPALKWVPPAREAAQRVRLFGGSLR